MKNLSKLALMATVLSPVFASAQLVTFDGPYNAGNPDPGLFYQTVAAMTLDNEKLYSAPFDPTPADSSDLSTKTDIAWDGTNWSLGPQAGQLNFTRIMNPVAFKFSTSMNIGYIGNENGHDNELWVNVFAGFDGANLLGWDEKKKLFDYDQDDHIFPNPTGPYEQEIDTPPVTWEITVADGVDSAVLQFEHVNRNIPLAEQMRTQENIIRFAFWAAFDDNGELTGDYLLAMSDQNLNFDSDRDDGIFYLQGADLVPVPEPSHIAGLAVLGLLGFIAARKRFKKSK